jgi:CelD/BcsL family acetyltransferase involved in cellulose biosynthesis
MLASVSPATLALRWRDVGHIDDATWDAWAELARRSGSRSVANERSWLGAWSAHLATGSVRLALVEDASGELMGGLAVHFTRRAGLRVLELAGGGLAAADHMSPLVDARDQAAAAATTRHLVEAISAERSDLIELDGLDASQPFAIAMRKLVGERGGEVRERALRYVACPDDWDDFLAGVSRSRRSHLRRRARAVEALGITSEQLDDAASVRAAIDELARWNATRHDGSTFGHAPMLEFHRHVAEAMRTSGQLRLRVLRAGSSPVAVSYCYRLGDEVHFYNTGYDPGYTHLHVGETVIAASLRASIEERATVFDFLRGDEPYKDSFTSTSRTNLQVRIPTSARGRAALAAVGLRRRVSEWRAGRDHPQDDQPDGAPTPQS